MPKTICLAVVVCLLSASGAAQRQDKSQVERAPFTLKFSEILSANPEKLEPSEKLSKMANHQVRIVGFMAQMEDGPKGAFYLCSRPVNCDESGAGIGDLPLNSVLVVVPSMKGKRIPHTPRLISVTGTLEIGDTGSFTEYPAPVRLILLPRQSIQLNQKPSNINKRR